MATERMLTPARLAEIFAARPRDCHKGMFGTVGLFGGVAYSGAAKLANLACAALRAGCGIARLAVPESIVAGVLPYLLESTLCPLPIGADGALRYDAGAAEDFTRGLCAVGVGMGWDTGRCDDAYRAYLTDLFAQAGLSLLVDAGGITALSRDLRLLSDARASVLLTPHPGEFSRLTGLPEGHGGTRAARRGVCRGVWLYHTSERASDGGDGRSRNLYGRPRRRRYGDRRER